MTFDRDRVVTALRGQREHIERDFGMRLIGIVGSVARGEATPDSDIDVLVDIVETPTLFQIVEAEQELEQAVGLGLPVEFVFREDLKPAMRARMERDFVPL
jgi:predicted nucleotidyltransferase